jgi:hypothetical protein
MEVTVHIEDISTNEWGESFKDILQREVGDEFRRIVRKEAKTRRAEMEKLVRKAIKDLDLSALEKMLGGKG